MPPAARVRRNGDMCVWCGFAGDTACAGAPSGLRGTVIPRNCPYIALYTKTGRKCGYLVHQVNNAAAGSITGISHVRKTGKTFQVDHIGSFRIISKHCGSA
jgi:hypothetical protein